MPTKITPAIASLTFLKMLQAHPHYDHEKSTGLLEANLLKHRFEDLKNAVEDKLGEGSFDQFLRYLVLQSEKN